MTKQLFFPTILMLSLCTTATAQDLHVYYDVFRDSVWYVKGGEKTETPSVRKRDLVQLHVVEYNNYLYSIMTEQKELSEESGKSDLVNTLFPDAGGSIDGFLKNLPLGKIGAGFSGMIASDLQGYTSGRQNNGTRGEDIDVNFKSAGEYIEKLWVITEELQTLSGQIASLSKRISAGSLSVDYLDDLLKSSDLPPTQIKEMVMEHLDLMFGSDFVENPTLKGALSWGDNVQALRDKSARMSQLRDRWAGEKPDFDKAVYRLSQLVADMNEKERDMFVDLQNKRDEVNLRDLQIASFTDSLGSLEEMAASVTADKLGALYRKTREVKNHRFEHNETFKPVGREMDIVLKFTLKEEKKGSTDPETHRIRTIRVTNYEGFKYTITPGFCVAGFFTPQKRYSIALNNNNETIIAESDADKFAPLVTTAVQVYNDRGKRVTPGALLGLAVPLTQNGGQGQSLNFVLGPSLVIGRDQRISISLGLMGGKTTRLSQGVTPFQPFDTQNGVRPIPTIDRYEFGWYFGVTGNL